MNGSNLNQGNELLLTEFSGYLLKSRVVQEKNAPHYVRWVRRFLTSGANPSASLDDRLMSFLDREEKTMKSVLRSVQRSLTRYVGIISLFLLIARPSIATPETDALCKQLAETPGDTALLTKLKAAIPAVTDVDQKAKLSVIYCLGCLYTGNNKEASAV